jgi:hypothetical protein
VAKLIIDRLIAALRLPHPLDVSQQLLWLVALGFGLAALGLFLREGINYQRQVLAERLTGYVSLSILAHTQLDSRNGARDGYHAGKRQDDPAPSAGHGRAGSGGTGVVDRIRIPSKDLLEIGRLAHDGQRLWRGDRNGGDFHE